MASLRLSGDLRRAGRWLAFNTVGAAGMAVQLASLWIFTGALGWSYLPATAAAVELAIIHNFFWHRRWTWADRPSTRPLPALFARFNLTTGAISLAGNLGVMALLLECTSLHYMPASLISIAACSVATFVVCDLGVFEESTRTGASRPERRLWWSSVRS